ncbi:MAG: hypothetical protein JWM74_1489 [Myxococcaceae bacterium]|nr:hypothetical protein [Myxococcaceae bacterium]
MLEPGTHDLVPLDAAVRRAHVAWKRWRRDLARDPEAHADTDVFLTYRSVANKALYDELGGGSPPLAEVELRRGLRRWVARLLQARNTHDADVELARVCAAKDARITLEPAHKVSWLEAWRGVVTEPTRPASIASLDAAAQRGSDVGPLVRARRERREEVLHRLGLDGETGLAPAPAADCDALARAVLAATDDLAAATLREWRKKQDLAEVLPSGVDSIRAALAPDATEGWPGRPQDRWLAELFGAHVRGMPIELGPLAPATGAASFARALEAFGGALRRAADPRAPFTLHDDPYFVDAYRVGAVFGSLAASPTFQKKALETSARVAAMQARTIAFTLLFEVRLRAMRWLLARDPRATPRDLFEELTFRVLGASLPSELAGAWPIARDDEAAILLGTITAPALERELKDRFDEDWFKNPRAFDALRGRAMLAVPEEDTTATDVAHATTLARAFEQVLG